MIVAIDGPSGVGKSTIARAIAGARGMHYLDTGATYRAATVAVLDAGIDPDDGEAVVTRTRSAAIGYQYGVVTLDGRDVTARVRDPDVTAAVSAVSAYPEVRSLVVDVQRAWVGDHPGDAVVEGRDIGTVVFPDAPVKIFLTADPEIRAARRAGDAESAGTSTGAIEADLRRRDHHDSTRATSPLTAADDAHVLDTSHMSIEEVVDEVLRLVDAESGRPQPV